MTLAPGPGHGRGTASAARSGAEAAPLFAALARQWRSEGRVVPGARDHEWELLVGRPAWPRH
ncbi:MULTISPECIES: hypothetical protein [Streptomyces]|uniref:Uncharacterized protein n=1 Tax=Streptomyces sudanensis TaxID=436397 RepID=A0ABY4TJC8_9ACTN|nr:MULTISPECIES: hypothetical protein [Streptomyces]MCP9957970.1 hypothetical protein [Streptomyces sudanensis]MCQ0001503.1 hypothetical protein [Streptomyces sudanensis]URN17110.1 hypothetical protein MW084_15510 [Streptomyces sudanensis]